MNFNNHPNIFDNRWLSDFDVGAFDYIDYFPSSNPLTSFVEIQYDKDIVKFKNETQSESVSREAVISSLMEQIMVSLPRMVTLQQPHKEHLEKLAIDTVLSIPEFEPLVEMVKSGKIKLDIKLESPKRNSEIPNEISDDVLEQENQYIEENCESLDNLTNEIIKRKFINILSQGNSINKLSLYFLSKEHIDNISPDLMGLYSKFLSVTECMKYIQYPSGMEIPSAESEIQKDQDSDGMIIKARAEIFPLLIHEFVKGAMELLAWYNIPDHMKAHVLAHDAVKDEFIGMMIGPQIWNKFSSLVPVKDQKYLMYLYNKYLQVPTENPDTTNNDFLELTRNIISQNSVAKNWMETTLHTLKFDIEKHGSQYHES